ncbi:hypothetical protein ABGB12_13425 [Actinocorallia sp. B10E7]|uniref:hypothetical protein n=1 Tax=Actinocorallia sp. B10E7 TaxID=3153558 RepID=UPI00325F2BB3
MINERRPATETAFDVPPRSALDRSPTETVYDLPPRRALEKSPTETVPDLPVRPAAQGARRSLYRYAGLLVAIDVLVVARDLWAAQILLVPLLLTVPGLLLLRALRIPASAIAAFPLYVPAASLMTLMGSGLAVNLVGPLVGVDAPLRAVPLLIGLQLCLGALLLAGARAPDDTLLDWSGLPSPRWTALLALVPLVAAMGALRLNTGHDSVLAIVSIVLCLLILTVSTTSADRLTPAQLSVMLFVVALAMMWSFSLRSDLVYGFDIATEYGMSHRTVQAGYWKADNSTDAYGAMLSITLLPAQLHALTGMADVVVLKLVFPAVFAMFPIGVFRLAHRFLPQRWAFLAAAYTLVQGGVFQQLPALARQEIALLMFLALINVVFDDRVSGRQRALLIAVLTPGMIVSHYSTAYLAVAIFGGGVVLQLAVSAVRRRRALNLAVLAVFAAGLGSGALWYGLVTQSASNLSTFSSSLSTSGLRLLPNTDGKGNLISGYLKGTETSGIKVKEYSARLEEQYAERTYVVPFEDAGDREYALYDKPMAKPPVLVPMLRGILNTGELYVQQFGNLLGLLGALILVSKRNSPGAIRVIGLLSVPALTLLALFRLSGTFAASYNQGRAQLQAMILLAVPMFWLLHRLPGRLERFARSRDDQFLDRLIRTTAAGALLTIFLNTTGFVGTFFGGGTSTNLTSSGEDHDRFYIQGPELAGAEWMGSRVALKELVYADRYGALRLYAMTQIKDRLITDITPRTLHRTGWIYAGRSNTVDERTRSLVDNRLAVFNFPTAFVQSHYNLVYSNGYSGVYRR